MEPSFSLINDHLIEKAGFECAQHVHDLLPSLFHNFLAAEKNGLRCVFSLVEVNISDIDFTACA